MNTPHDRDDLSLRLTRFIAKRVHDSHAVEDLVQDVLLKLHTHHDRLPDEPQRVLAWALRTARNAVMDRYRSRRHRDLPLEAAGPVAVQREASSTASADLARCLMPMVARLPDTYRVPVELADLQGLPQGAVAQRLGLSVSGAKSRVQRGRQQLRAMVSQCCLVTTDRRGAVESFQPTSRSAEFCGAKENGEESCVRS